MSGHIAVVSNPYAGRGRGGTAAEVALAHLRALGAEVRAYEGSSADDTHRLTSEALAEHPAALVIVGGDGTVTGALDVLCASEVPLVLVPAGTGNDLARALGLPRDDPAAAVELALHGVARPMDIGEVHSGGRSTLFLTVAALGFDAKVSDRTNRLRWPKGALRYYLALLIEVARLRPTAFRISFDGSEAVEMPGTLVAVGNTASYGGGMPVCAGARPDDGWMDAVHIAPLGRLRLIRLFPLLLTGNHLRRPEVVHRQVHEVEVSAPDLVVYADGERVGAVSCRITQRPSALRVMVPVADGAQHD